MKSCKQSEVCRIMILHIVLLDAEQSGTRTLGRRTGLRRKRDAVSEVEAEDQIQPEVEIDQELDRELENKSRQHNLTSANVRSIIHVSMH